jgi:hypothetical protein
MSLYQNVIAKDSNHKIQPPPRKATPFKATLYIPPPVVIHNHYPSPPAPLSASLPQSVLEGLSPLSLPTYQSPASASGSRCPFFSCFN